MKRARNIILGNKLLETKERTRHLVDLQSDHVFMTLVTGCNILSCFRKQQNGLEYKGEKMYLKSLRMQNFRKYGEFDNEVEFVNGNGLRNKDKKEDEGINIAESTTLIVGKNNAGKTTIVEALRKLIKNTERDKLTINDFNLSYLIKWLDDFEQAYKSEDIDIEDSEKLVPFMEFELTIALDKDADDLVTNMIPFMLIQDARQEEVHILVHFEIEEIALFIDNVKNVIDKVNQLEEDFTPSDKFDRTSVRFRYFKKCLQETKFVITYYRKESDGNVEKLKEYNLSKLMDITCINANNVSKSTCLSEAFNKIVKYRYEKDKIREKEKLEASLEETNDSLRKQVNDAHNTEINKVVGKIISRKSMQVSLQPDITLDKLMSSLIRYEYIENDMNIPEDQFGMGYTHLVMIIATLIDYMDHYPEDQFNSKINLITIEEPEVFMHPQMQELFIKNVNSAINELITSKEKNVNSQLIVTTHSSHILNSKIHSGNSFNDIVYVHENKDNAVVNNLGDASISPGDDNEFKFLKKHIKYKVSELFFCDAVILVEGFAEETILPYYLDNESKYGLSQYYISIFSINGAHAYLYENLLKQLGIPSLIITDLDIKRDKIATGDDGKKVEDISQITELTGRKTTNETIKHFHGSYDISDIKELKYDNIFVTYQGKIGDYYATSFEEAFILTNWDNDITNEILQSIKPNIYEKIVGKTGKQDRKNNKKSSYEWQVKLEKEKGTFASKLLYELIMEEADGKLPVLPKYITKGLEWIKGKLEGTL